MAREKLEDYLLNPRHQVGRHKARVFAAALGIRQRDWEYLRDRLEASVLGTPITSVRETEWGNLYEVVVEIDGLNGQRRQVMTVWLASDEEPPRFITAYVLQSPVGA